MGLIVRRRVALNMIVWRVNDPESITLDIAAAIGPAVRRHRELVRLSQDELGARAGVDRTYVGQVERGRRNPTMVSLQRIAHGLGIELDVLVATAREIAAGRD